MNSQTRIIVLNHKNLIIALIAVVILIAGIIVLSGLNTDKKGNTNSIKGIDNASAQYPASYTAGVYSSTVLLNGNPVEIKVTIDDNLIHNVSAANVSESIETMYPLFNSCFDDIASQVVTNNSADNITYSSENKYTSIVLLDAIKNAIQKSAER